MSNGDTALKLAGKAWYFLRSGNLRGLWFAARHKAMADKWYRDGGETKLRFDYPLTHESTVLDVGGYRGCFIREIVARYDAHAYVFEPVPEFCEQLAKQFRINAKVKVCGYGLSNVDSISQMRLANESSTIYMTGGTQATIRLRDIRTVVQELGIKRIDLIKINIEGGEYVLLRRMLETGLVSICRDIQVQFHEFYPCSQRLRSEIRSALQETHFVTYDYPFVWENWRKKPISTARHGSQGTAVRGRPLANLLK
jgi:FkbM family methyltransferase